MGVQKFGPRQVALNRVQEHKSSLLLSSVDASIRSAKEQVFRSIQIVSRSHEIVDRTRAALARADRIRHGIHPAPVNPTIGPPSSHER